METLFIFLQLAVNSTKSKINKASGSSLLDIIFFKCKINMDVKKKGIVLQR